MKNILFLVIVFIGITSVYGQSEVLSKINRSEFMLQANIRDIWAVHELRLSDMIVLRSELAPLSIYTGYKNQKSPKFLIGPRWYHNMYNEVKSDAWNTSIIGGINYSYIRWRRPNILVEIAPPISHFIRHDHYITSYLGVKRYTGQGFNAEFSAGVQAKYSVDLLDYRKTSFSPVFDLRVGYSFKKIH